MLKRTAYPNCQNGTAGEGNWKPHRKAVNVERFLKIVEKYTDIKELTPEILREFIERIEIYERSVYRGKDATQQIDIYYNFIALMP